MQYRAERFSTGTIRRAVTAPDGTLTERLIGTDGSDKTTLTDGSVLNISQGPDPRFGMLAPVSTSLTTTIGGITSTVTTIHNAVLSDPKIC